MKYSGKLRLVQWGGMGDGGRRKSVDFLLDTGATYSMLTEAPGPLSP